MLPLGQSADRVTSGLVVECRVELELRLTSFGYLDILELDTTRRGAAESQKYFDGPGRARARCAPSAPVCQAKKANDWLH